MAGDVAWSAVTVEVRVAVVSGAPNFGL